MQCTGESTVRRFFELLNAEDLEGVRALLTEDAAPLPQARDMPGAGEYRGRDVIVDVFLKPIRGMFAPGSPSNRILSLAANGPLVLVETHGTGHLKDGACTTTATPGRSSCAASALP